MAPLPSLLDRARRGTWSAIAAAVPAQLHESDFVYVAGQYYIFNTDDTSNYTKVRSSATLAGLVDAAPYLLRSVVHPNISSSTNSSGTVTFVTATANGLNPGDLVWIDGHPAFDANDVWLTVTASTPPFSFDVPGNSTGGGAVGTINTGAKVRYPTAAFDLPSTTWHLWGTDPNAGNPKHYTVTDPFLGLWSVESTQPFGGINLADLSVRKHPQSGLWYAVGFAPSGPLELWSAKVPNGPWSRIGYPCDVFNDVGPPAWAALSRPDPNLAFHADGTAWLTFSAFHDHIGGANIFRSSIVQLNLFTGRTVGSPVVIFDMGVATIPGTSITGVSDAVLMQVAGLPDKVFCNTDSAAYPLAVLSLLDTPVTDGRAAGDLVRLDMSAGKDIGAGIKPGVPAGATGTFGAGGITTTTTAGGAYGYIAAATLQDFTLNVEFTPSTIAAGQNSVAHIGGVDYTTGASVEVQINAAGVIVAIVTASDLTTTTLTTTVTAVVGTRYVLQLRKLGNGVGAPNLFLSLGGVVVASATFPGTLTLMETWQLSGQVTATQAVRYGFQGTVHVFNLSSSGQLAGWYGQGAQV
jgi:hypothetical protein